MDAFLLKLKLRRLGYRLRVLEARVDRLSPAEKRELAVLRKMFDIPPEDKAMHGPPEDK